VADRPLLEVESNPAGSELFLKKVQRNCYTRHWRGFLFSDLMRVFPQMHTATSFPSMLQYYGLAIGAIRERFAFSAASLLLCTFPAKVWREEISAGERYEPAFAATR